MERVEVLKTYKIYIGGKFPRTESGRYYTPEVKGTALGNICLSSRKDVRNAVKAARAAQGGWASRSAYNRSQIIYRIGEMLEGRRAQFVAELQQQGASEKAAVKEVNETIDRLIYFAGWADKYQQVFSAVNPVASAHFNFSVYEPTGIVNIVAPDNSSLLGLVSTVIPAICGGNTVVVLASESKPLCAITFAEVLNSSDVPGGVVNILTGKADELISHMSGHMDVNALVYARGNKEHLKSIQVDAVHNLKRVRDWSDKKWSSADGDDPYLILDLQEVKTTWHPIERITPMGSGY